MGPRWSPYDDGCAEWTDRFLAGGGDAPGTCNAGTDGGISGTGRAEAAFQHRSPQIGPLRAAVQWQNRGRTDADKGFADTRGDAADVELGAGLTLGAAFNDARDGVDDPGLDETKEGDQSFIVGTQARGGDGCVAANDNRSVEHETDGEGTFFDAEGAELYASLALDAWHEVYAGSHWLEPDDSDYNGELRTPLRPRRRLARVRPGAPAQRLLLGVRPGGQPGRRRLEREGHVSSLTFVLAEPRGQHGRAQQPLHGDSPLGMIGHVPRTGGCAHSRASSCSRWIRR